ncbi:MAG: helix-turn-helix domain-containing protein [Acidobacteriia bacterium]|nr:helix-turn-helix domain-containing protein [Terriglobia bacterium]
MTTTGPREMRVYSREFRMQVVRRILDGERVPALSKELGIHRKLLYEWMRRVNEGGETNLRERGRPRKAGTAAVSAPPPVSELERTVARQQLVIEFLQACLAASREVAQEQRDWRDGVFQAIEAAMQRQGGLSVETMCELARVARSGYYRYLRIRGAEAGGTRRKR